jgi:processive 1,2-diacylglycerol beta-glucosyltransferase
MSAVIPVLTAGFGEGHNAAARAVAAALGRRADAGACPPPVLRDLFLDAYGEARFARQRRAYLGLANRAPRLWACVYQALHVLPVEPLAAPFLGPVRASLDRAVAGAEVVVSAYPLYADLLRRRRLSPGATRPTLVTVVTDSLSVNRAWHRAPSDWYVAPNEPTAAVLARQGVPPARILPLGFPVDARLAAPALPPGPRPRVLLMLNPGRRDALALVRAVAAEDVELTVTVGRDEAVHAAVLRAVGSRARVVGWTDRLPELMLAHDVVMTKAGGATTHECIAAHIPMVFTQVIPGQEAGNARLVTEAGGGLLGLDPAAAAAALRSLLADGRAGLLGCRRALARLGDARGAERVADLVLRELQARRASVAATRAASPGPTPGVAAS